MGVTGKKEKQINKKKVQRRLPSSEKQATEPTNLWPELPKQLSVLIGRMIVPIDDIAFGSVVKTWKETPSQCSRAGKHDGPWLELTSPVDISYCYRVFNKAIRKYHYSFIYRVPVCGTSSFIAGFSGSEVIILGAASSNTSFFLHPGGSYIWGADNGGYQFLPAWDMKVPNTCALFMTSDVIENRMVVVFTGRSHPAFLYSNFLHMGEGENVAWMKQDCPVIDPNAPANFKYQLAHLQFTNAITVGSEIFALSLQGTLAVIQVIDSKPVIVAVSRNRAGPTIPTKHFREHMIHYDGKLFLVLLLFVKSINLVDSVEVHKLDFKNLSWVKTESLADRAIFVGPNCGMMVSAEKVGCRSNVIYYTQQKAGGWSVFEMKSGKVSPGTKSSQEAFSDWAEPIYDEEFPVKRYYWH